MKNLILILFYLIALQSCLSTKDESYAQLNILQEPIHLRDNLPINNIFGFPVDYPNMKGYRDVNPYGNITKYGKHLGSDLSKPGDSDLGDTIYSIGYGLLRRNTECLAPQTGALCAPSVLEDFSSKVIRVSLSISRP